MARTHPHTSSDAASPSTSSRITKSTADRSSSRSTRQRSRRLAEASSSGLLQGMVDEAQHVTAGASESSSSRGKGKSKAVDQPELEFGDFDDDWTMIEEDEQPVDPCPVTDKDIHPFRIMDLPTEIRLEIYRACLTRPYNILLSKREEPHHLDLDLDVGDIDVPEDLSGGSDEDGDTSFQLQMGSTHTQATSGPHRLPPRRNDFASRLRGGRPRRLPSGTATSSGSSNANAIPSAAAIAAITRRTAPRFRNRSNILQAPEPERNQTADPLLVNILRASKEIYKEARGVFYSENVFTLDLNTAMSTLACLHQRSRRHIKHVELEIPSYNEILERFQETVRLNLRYCSGLKKLVIDMPFTLPGADGSGTTGNTTVYANGFDILRWLPQECAIDLKGNICTEIETVVNKHLHLAKTLDKLAYARRQLISNDTGPSTAPPPTTTTAS